MLRMRSISLKWFGQMSVLEGLAIAFGAAIRVVQFSHDRSFWYDELWVALNLQHRSYTRLIYPLDHNQAAPLGFLVVAKVLLALGHDERWARLLPLLCSLLSIVLFARLCRALFARRAASAALF